MDVLFDVYDSVGGLSIDTEATLLFNNSRYMHRGMNLSSGEVIISPKLSCVVSSNVYVMFFQAKVTIDVVSGNNRTQSSAWIEVDTGSGFESIPGTLGYMYNRQAGSGLGTVLLNTTFHLNKNNGNTIRFRIRAVRVSGTNPLVTVANASNFIGLINL